MTRTGVREFRNSIAEEYDVLRFTKAYYRQVDKFERAYVLAKVRPGTSVLEIGPGTGRFTVGLVKVAFSVTAVDLSERMIKQLRRKVNSPRLTTRHLDVKHISTLQHYGEFDTVICMGVLPYLEDPISALTKMSNAVTEDGNVVFDFWNLYSFIGATRKFSRRQSQVLTKFHTYRRMLQIIEAAGLMVRDKVAWGYPRIGRFSLDRLGGLICKPLAYSVVFDTVRTRSSHLPGEC